jgi:hypothetical protein
MEFATGEIRAIVLQVKPQCRPDYYLRSMMVLSAHPIGAAGLMRSFGSGISADARSLSRRIFTARRRAVLFRVRRVAALKVNPPGLEANEEPERISPDPECKYLSRSRSLISLNTAKEACYTPGKIWYPPA